MNVNKFKKYIGKHVTVSTPYFSNKHRLCFITGVVLEVKNNHMLIKYNRNSLRRIALSDIINIRVEG